MKKSCLEVRTNKNKGKVLRSRLKILRNFRDYVISEISPGVYRVESCLSRTRKVSTLELLTPTNIRFRAMQSEVELQNQCAQLEKLKSTNTLLQKDLVELRQKLDKHCDKAKEATRKALGKLSAECEALRDNLKAAAARNAEQEQSIDLLKQELADLKVSTDKKSGAMEKMDNENDQLRSELQQLENYNQYLASGCRRKDTIIDRQMLSLKNEKRKPKQRPQKSVYSRFGKKMY